MKLARYHSDKALISLVPLIDVMLILLVFFMVTSTYLNLDMIPFVERSEEAPAGAGAALWIASLSNSMQVHPDHAVRRDFAAALGIESLSYADDRLAAFAQAQGIPVITLAPTLRAYAEANNNTLHGFPGGTLGYGHWNQTGHAQAGALIAEAICTGLP